MMQATTSIFDAFVHQPTECQSKALYLIEDFIEKPQECKAFVLRGSAGTGKTSLMQAVVKHLQNSNLNFILLAPTAKAAKVLLRRTGDLAHTIHSVIYHPEELADGKVKFNYRQNETEIRTIFIVDEASMLASERKQQDDFLTPNAILIDLMRFIQEGNALNQVIFIGDTYQLPPVGEETSLALSARLLSDMFNISTKQTTLKQVKRQADDSAVLVLANEVKHRNDIQQHLKFLPLERLKSENMALNYFVRHFDRGNLQNIIFIAQSNERVLTINYQVRSLLGLDDQILSKGDAVIAHRNWIGKDQSISKGDVGVILDVDISTEERCNLRFLNATIDFEGVIIKTKILVDSLVSPKGDVNKDAIKNLKNERMAKNWVYRASEKASDDVYMGAIYLRYAYAITCHKAQGSEWKEIMIDPRFNLNNHRWLYTAVTRAKDKVLSWWF